MNREFLDGATALMHSAVACVMEQAGLTEIHISREQLATAFDRMSIHVTQGVMSGMTVRAEAKRIEPMESAPLISATSYEPHPEPEALPAARIDCTACDGNGYITKGAGGCRKITCKDCNGVGTVLNWD